MKAHVFAADGTRLVRVVEGGVTVFLPGGQEVRSDGAGVTATRWYTFAGTTVATRTGVGMAAVASVVTDPHGTPVAHVHNTNWAAPVNRIRTDPFGNARTGQAGTHAGRGFLGAPTDPTGLTLLGARFYDPATGTFVSVDPLLDPMLPAQYNAYVYAGNNPLTWADPTGEAWQMDPDNPRANTINTGLATIVASPARRQGGSGVATTTNVSGVTGAPAYAAGGCGYSYNPCGAPTRSPAETAAMASAAAHGTLTALGLVPGVGEIADGLDALVCLAENDMICAGLSAAATIPFAGWAAALGKFGRIGANTAEATADAALAAGRTSGAAAELRVGGQVFTDVSTGGVPRALNGSVQQALDAVPLTQRAPWHGACAEIGCLSQAFDAGVNPTGGFIRAVAIGTSNPGHGLPSTVLNSLGVGQ